MDLLTTSPMFLDDGTNEAVEAFKGVVPYSHYKDEILYCRLSNTLAMKKYGPPTLSKDRHTYIWKMTYTYDSWTPVLKKVTLKVHGFLPRVTFADETTIQEIDPLPTRQAPPRMSPSPTVQVYSPMRPCESPIFDLRQNMYEPPIRANRRRN